MDRWANRRLDADPLPLHRLGQQHRPCLWAVVGLLILGTALRAGMLAQDVRFHPDEALYASYARRMSRYGDLLLPDVPLDKPPLGLALTALSFSALGPTEFAARLTTVSISLLTLATLYALARRFYGINTALLALLLLALSPFDLAFAATVFHDPLLTLWLVLMALCAGRDRWWLAGICAACALATKQSAVQFIPIFAGVGAVGIVQCSWRLPDYGRRLRRFALPLIVGGLLLALWSAARAAPVDFWTLGVTNPGQLRFIRADEVGPRLARWLEMLQFVVGAAPLLALAALPPIVGLFGPARRERLIDLWLASGVLATLLAYWLLAYNTYDRYLHPLGPLLLLLVARGTLWLGARLPRPARIALVLLLLAGLMPGALAALRGELPIGGDLGAHNGIEKLAAAIQALPAGAIVYDYWLGWELGYYLGEQPTVQIVYQPTPEAFAHAVCAAAAPGYLAAPSSRAARWLRLARDNGASVEQLLAGPFALYRLDCTF